MEIATVKIVIPTLNLPKRNDLRHRNAVILSAAKDLGILLAPINVSSGLRRRATGVPGERFLLAGVKDRVFVAGMGSGEPKNPPGYEPCSPSHKVFIELRKRGNFSVSYSIEGC